jgi:NTP pyrophosphatase (non-canonical NTP hydrolase)
MEQLQTLMNDISKWSDDTFGFRKRNPSIVYHLKKEVDELIESLHKSNALGTTNPVGVSEFSQQLNETKMEFADCFMLLLDSAHHFNISAEQLINLTREKLEINKNRKWGLPDANGVVEHVR